MRNNGKQVAFVMTMVNVIVIVWAMVALIYTIGQSERFNAKHFEDMSGYVEWKEGDNAVFTLTYCLPVNDGCWD